MKREPQVLLTAQGATTPARMPPALGALLLALAAVLTLHHATLLSMLHIWWRSPTFAHGFLILPVSAWLAWRRRAALRHLAEADQAARPSGAGLLLLAALGAAWLLAELAHVQVMQQLLVVTMLPACVLAVLGWRALALLAFPLAYLFLCVPFGAVLITPLIDFTAGFTVTALQWSGVPVYREGSYFSLPSGNWSVVEACSGLRYLIASLALGVLFAHLHFQHAGKRAAIVAAALLLPILANGVRAYLIVMLGHYSDMRVAVGVDHLIYGWLFFGLVALLLFLASRRWRAAPGPVCPLSVAPAAGLPRASKANTLAALLCLPLCALWPALAQAIEQEQQAGFTTTLPALQVRQISGWQRVPPQSWAWRAPLAGAPRELIASQAGEDGAVQLQLAWYRRQARASELLSHLDQPYGPHSLLLDSRTRRVALPAGSLQVRESLLARPSHRLLVWRFYRQSGVTTANGALVKLLLARGKLLHSRQDGTLIIVSAPYEELGAPPRALLQAYLRAALPSIEQAIEEMPHD
ncbi:exosortase A [Janthinobacterium aquaticum]|uniref:exosortase A n=1 Tax=Janthinobacterium sp. FT58W TaxID=2654254 RepID=UPI001265543A|nr:exosortase A [Janthinobacterium sp. FT58W]KAB8041576.1 exosortase A [Janthinobacterium sp. FT58W]